MANASRNRNSWTEKFENIYRDLKDLWLDTQDVLQLANPRYGLLTRYDNLDDETKAQLKSMKVKIVLKNTGGVEEAKLYIPEYDREEVKAGITMIHKMGFVFTIQNLEQFVQQLLEACVSYIMDTTLYVRGPNVVFWQQAKYLCGTTYSDGNSDSSTAKEVYAYLKDRLNVAEDLKEGSSIDYLNFIEEHFLPMEDSRIIIFEFLTRMRLEKLKMSRVENILEALMDIIPFEFQRENGECRKKSKNNLKQYLLTLLGFLLRYSKSDKNRPKFSEGAVQFETIANYKDNNTKYVIFKDGELEKYFVRPMNLETLQNLITLYNVLSLHDHRSFQRNVYAVWKYMNKELPEFNILVRCEIIQRVGTERESKITSTPDAKERVQHHLNQLWNYARTNQNEQSFDNYEAYMNAREFSKYLAKLIGKLVSVIMMIKFREEIARVPLRDLHHRSRVTNPPRDNLPNRASIFGFDEKDITIIAQNMNQLSNIEIEEALK